MTRAEWDAAIAKAVAEVEADRVRQLEAILDAHCPGSRRPYCAKCKSAICICGPVAQAADRSANHLAAGIENRLAGGVASASVGSLREE